MTGPITTGLLNSPEFIIASRVGALLGAPLALLAGLIFWDMRADVKEVKDGFAVVKLDVAVLKSQLEANVLNDITLRKRVDRLEHRGMP